MILILGKGVSNRGVRRMAEYLKIPYDFLELSEVKYDHYDYIVKSPSIKLSEDYLVNVLSKNIEVISDIEFAYRHFPKKNFVMITGTNGKTTTTTLVGLMLNGIACGNIGYSVCDAIMDHLNKDTFICELSSFQLDCTSTFRPKIACLLNLGSAHLDYHHTMDNYHQAKLKSLYRQSRGDAVIYNMDDSMINFSSKAKKITFSLFEEKAQCFIRNGFIYYGKDKIYKIKSLKIKGKYNLYNVMASICISKILKIKNHKIRKTLNSFRGIAFRNELICKNVINDAKSTNPLSTLAALTEVDRCVLICGGKPRGENLSILDNQLRKVLKVYCYGEGKDIIYDYMKSRRIDVERFPDLKEAVSKVKKDRIKGQILFSPFMASLDQYKNYEERGIEFNRYFNV